MKLVKLPKDALPVEDHWEWQERGRNVHGWADQNGLLHREGAPAYISYWRDGTIRGESWWLHGKPHREGGPSYIMYWQDGTIESEWWWFHGQPHREGAPAVISSRADGTIERESWYLHGEKMKPEYPMGVYQDLQARIGRPAMWTLPGNLIPVLLGFLQ